MALAGVQTFPSINTAPEPAEPPTTGTLTVIKEVRCPAGITCPSAADFQMEVAVNDVVTDTFDGEPSPGTQVDIEPGTYDVDEGIPTLPAGQTVSATESPDCSGTISAGESKTCTFTNTISVGVIR